MEKNQNDCDCEMEAAGKFLSGRLKESPAFGSVYRVQLNREFTFRQACEIIPYLKKLGVDAVYCSPYLEAVPGSLHGYNVANPHSINPEIGTAEDFEAFCAALRENGLKQVLDVVPNHMGISGNNNRWWMDVLENGPSSIYSHFFDINWNPVKKELEDKILLPILGDYYGRVLENEEIRLSFSEGGFVVTYYGYRLPVAPKTYPMILESGIHELEEGAGKEHPDYLEYLSIITAFRNLPLRTERDPQKISERNREKQIAKQRLTALLERSGAIREFVEGRIRLFNGIKTNPKSFDALDRLLNEQSYRIAYWRVASEEINYRRFFDINELASIRIEDEKVFEAYHELIFRLIREGKVHGLRVDHPDGLYNPPAYFENLQLYYLRGKILRPVGNGESVMPELASIPAETRRGFLRLLGEKAALHRPPLFVVVEKILDHDEDLPENWMVDGTVGYEFLNALNGLFVKQPNAGAFSDIYENFIGHKINFEQVVYEKKKFFALIHMASEINNLGHLLDQISEKDRAYRDFTRNNLTLAIRELIACFPVYRTYISPEDTEVTERDRRFIHQAVERAKMRTPALNPAVYDFLRDILLLKLDSDLEGDEKRVYRDVVLRFQQLTGPIMAKGLEDTAFYIYNRLVSLNEVGGDPFRFGYSAESFHRQNAERNRNWPLAFLTTSTHDTKRSEDLRMRVNTLSENPEEWKINISKWAAVNEKHKTPIREVLEPRRNTEYFIYQTLLGVWPDEMPSGKALEVLIRRLEDYLVKAVREGKIYSNWINPNFEHENAVKKFLRGILASPEENPFLEMFLPVQRKISRLGKLNALSALVLKEASPGVTDHYQGTEVFEYSLVDPDNRRPVDFNLRRKMLDRVFSGASNAEAREAFIRQETAGPSDGAMKIFMLRECLALRSRYPDLFVGGEYFPLEVEGERKENVVALIRKKGPQIVLAAAARFFSELVTDGDGSPTGDAVWKDTRILLPKNLPMPEPLKDVFTRRDIPVHHAEKKRCLKASDVFALLTASWATNLEI
ncbi:MAG TPA: malto-oligosyltrehalose synthase [Candidatus Omnitrophota bacterium]|nr:malto-oligosyltrehalose synthase [Candidatus Omnitrophota bacterium]